MRYLILLFNLIPIICFNQIEIPKGFDEVDSLIDEFGRVYMVEGYDYGENERSFFIEFNENGSLNSAQFYFGDYQKDIEWKDNIIISINESHYYQDSTIQRVQEFDSLGQLINVYRCKSLKRNVGFGFCYEDSIKTIIDYGCGFKWLVTFDEKGRWHGEIRVFSLDGEVLGILNYSNGKKEGKQYYYSHHPELQNTSGIHFKDSKVVSSKGLYEMSHFKNDKLDGERVFFYPNGKELTKRFYEKGKLKQVLFIKDKDGNNLEIGAFKDGTGTVNIYDFDGDIIDVEEYKNGKLIIDCN